MEVTKSSYNTSRAHFYKKIKELLTGKLSAKKNRETDPTANLTPTKTRNCNYKLRCIL